MRLEWRRKDFTEKIEGLSNFFVNSIVGLNIINRRISMKCFICKQEVKTHNGKHIYYCAKKNNVTLDKSDIRYKQICYNVGFKVSKDFFEEKYVKEKWSLPDFKRELGLAYKQTQFLLKYFDIKSRSIKESTCLEKTREKYKKTCKGKYGVDNVSKVSDVKEKKKQTFLKNYGVDNIWKDKEYYVWLHQHMLDKYGAKSLPNRYGNMKKWWDSLTDDQVKKMSIKREITRKRNWDNLTEKQKKIVTKKRSDIHKKYWASLTDDQKNAYMKKRLKNYGKVFSSKLEIRISETLQKLGIRYKWQFWIAGKVYDFKIKHTKTIIEVNGDYWHANPRKYKSNDLINYPKNRGFLACDIWKKDFDKRKLAHKYGYSILYMWECDINKMDDDQLDECVLEMLHENCKNKINKKNK